MENKIMYLIQYNVSKYVGKTVKYLFKPVYLYIEDSIVNKEEGLYMFIAMYYRHMYNIDLIKRQFSCISVKQLPYESHKIDYSLNKKLDILHVDSGLDLRDMPPIIYNQSYKELQMDVVKWFIDMKVLETAGVYRPARELSIAECKEVVKIFETLTELEKEILILRYFINKDFTVNSFELIAETKRITPQRVRQIELNAIRKLKSPIRLTALKRIFSNNIQKDDDYYIKTMFDGNDIRFVYDQGLDISHISLISIDELDLSVRAYNCLRRANLLCIGDIMEYSENRLKKIRNLGQKSREDLINKLSNYGVFLTYDLGDYDRIFVFNPKLVKQPDNFLCRYDYQSFKRLLLDLNVYLNESDSVALTVKREPKEVSSEEDERFSTFTVSIKKPYYMYNDEDIYDEEDE